MFPPLHHRRQGSRGDRAIKRLLIRPGAIGDCFLSLPALQFLQADYTEVWVPTSIMPLIQFADRVDSLASTGIDTFGIEGFPVCDKLLARLRSFDEVVTWYGSNRSEFRNCLQAAGVNCIFHSPLPPQGGDLHATDFFAVQVGAPAGLIPQLTIANHESRHTLVIHPFSGSARKNWPLSLYQQLAAQLPLSVEWLAGPAEELEDAVRFSDLGDLARWLRGAQAYLGNDSGITHIAAALGIPTLALFGPTDPRVWCSRGVHVRHLKHEPLAELSVETVYDLLTKILTDAKPRV